jgi:hypothetical protein
MAIGENQAPSTAISNQPTNVPVAQPTLTPLTNVDSISLDPLSLATPMQGPTDAIGGPALHSPVTPPEGKTQNREYKTRRWAVAALCGLVVLTGSSIWMYAAAGRDKAAIRDSDAISTDARQWLVAKQANSAVGFEAYLAASTNGEHSVEAKELLVNLTRVVEPIASASPSQATASAVQAAPVGSPASSSVLSDSPLPAKTGLVQSTAIGLDPRPSLADVGGAHLQASAPAAAVSKASESVAPVVTGEVILQISPWGNVKVDKKPMGASPPLKRLQLSEGVHQIEMSNPAAQKVTTVVEVKKDKPVVLIHRFE